MKRWRRLLLTLLLLTLLLVTTMPVDRTLAAASHPAQRADSLVDSIGVNTHLYFDDTRYGNFLAYEPLLVASGIRHIRDGNASPYVNQRGTEYYPRLRDLAKKGIHATLINDPRNDNQTAQQQVSN